MESASIAVGGAHAREHHGPPEAHASSRIDRQTLGILLFIVSEVMLFGAFFASYFFIRAVANDGPWPPDGFELPVLIAGINTVILVSSSFTIHWALEGIRRNNRNALMAVHPRRLQRPRRRLRVDLLRAHRPPRGARLRRPAAAHVRQHPGLARPLRPRREGPSRRRGAGHLLALRRRDVDHRLRQRLRAVAMRGCGVFARVDCPAGGSGPSRTSPSRTSRAFLCRRRESRGASWS